MTKRQISAVAAVVGDAESKDPASDLGKQLRTGGMWVLIGKVVGIGTTILATLVLARALSHADFGAFGLLMSILTTSSVVAMCGLNMVVVRSLAESLAANDVARAIRVLKMTWVIAGTTILLASSAVMMMIPRYLPAILFDHNRLVICSLSAITVALLACNNLMAATLRGFDEQKLATFLGPQHSGGPIGAALFLGLLMIMATNRSTYLETVLLLYIAAYVLCIPVAILWIWAVARKRMKATQIEPTRILSEFTPRIALTAGFLLMLTQVLGLAMRESDLWIAGGFGQPGDLELFVAARRIVQIIAVPLGLVDLTVITMIPRLSSEGRIRDLQRLIRSAANLAASISAACAIVVLFVPELVLRLLLGPYYQSAAVPLTVLCFGQLVFAWTGPCKIVLMMTGNERWALAVNAMSIGALLLGGPYVIRQWGLIGLATYSSSMVAAQNLVQWFLAYRLTGLWTHAAPSFGHRRLHIGED